MYLPKLPLAGILVKNALGDHDPVNQDMMPLSSA
jgi:hypothetical protein